jgi:quercetin dioxygenase-like cupin family protein
VQRGEYCGTERQQITRGKSKMKAGDGYENPATGERGILRTGSEDSGGELFAAEMFVRPGGRVSGEHVHSYFDERFEVLEGVVPFRLNGRESVATPGQSVHIPPGTVHDWWNAGEGEVRALIELRPAGASRTCFSWLPNVSPSGLPAPPRPRAAARVPRA